MRTYGVPWNQPLPTHRLVKVILSSNRVRGITSYIYKKLQDKLTGYIGISAVWNADLKNYTQTID